LPWLKIITKIVENPKKILLTMGCASVIITIEKVKFAVFSVRFFKKLHIWQ
jgi:hypothetical protein